MESQDKSDEQASKFLEEVLKIKVPPLPRGLRDQKLRRQMLRETIDSLK